ncbi:MAG: hypothetical protein IGR90_06230 [Synechococcales cyanobacterium K32_A2020_035]|nr:hypothetical protein [Synechococcales cyanobacterium K32_A2020_035]
MTAQHLLTSALEVSATLSIAYIALALAAFISRINTSAAAPTDESHPELQNESQPAPTPAPVPAQPKAIKPVAIAVVPAQVKSQPVESPLKSLKVPQLQKMARDRGLTTRAKGSDRRLNKRELLALLQ